MGETLVGRTRAGRFARRFRLLLVPLVVAGAATFATPSVALGITGATNSGVTTYVVNPDKNEIDVTVAYTIKNTTKSKSATVTCYEYFTCTQTTDYYFNGVHVLIDASGGPVSVTSNAGKVTQAAYSGSDTPSGLRALKLTYPNVWYGQTRSVTAKYAIPAGMTGTSFKALKSYASVCATTNIWTAVDSEKINVVLPAGFKVISAGGMDAETATNGTTTLSTTNTNIGRYACVEAINPAGLESATATGANTSFTVQSWPEDAAWKTSVTGFIAADAPKIEAFTGLPMAKGPFALAEAAEAEVAVGYDTDKTPTVRLPGKATEAQVIQAMAEEGYGSAFAEPWMAAGLAGYAQQIAGSGSGACTAPTSGQPLSPWRTVAFDTRNQDRAVHDQQEQMACSIFSAWAKDAGHDRFVAALTAASRGDNPYAAGSTTAAASASPITTRLLLDMVDERAMIPAGLTDLDRAQNLLADTQVLPLSDLRQRSEARAQYHALATSAGTWSIPPVIREAMASWKFEDAKAAMETASQIVALRDQTQKTAAGLKLDGTKLQQDFEAAKSQAELSAVLTLAKSESEAAGKVAEAARLQGADRSILQSIGLVGADVSTPLEQARTALAAVKPADASSSAQSVIDTMNGAGDQGTLRAGIAGGVVLALLLLLVVALVMRRRRNRAAALAAASAAAASAPAMPQPNVFDPAAMAGYSPAWSNSPESTAAGAASWAASTPPDLATAAPAMPENLAAAAESGTVETVAEAGNPDPGAGQP